MARFGKRGQKRKRRFGKRRKLGTVKKVAKRVRRIEKSIETKFWDRNETATSITAAGKFYGLNYGIFQGAGPNDRVGIEFVGTSLEIRMELEVPLVALTGDNFNRLRVVVGWDKMPQGAGVPVIGDLFVQPPTSPNTLVGMRQWVTRKRFRILYDKIITIYAPQSGGATVGFMKNYFKKLHFKLGRKKTIFSSNNGLETGIDKNLLFMFVVSDSTVASFPTLVFSSRFKYQDM